VEETGVELNQLLEEPHLQNIPVLILANKAVNDVCAQLAK
jgi:hypothetical protein